VGFDLIGLSGKNWQMAHVNSASKERVGRYGVNVSAIDSAVEHELITGTGSVYIIDEIGKMELLSEQFRHVIENLWQSSHTVIATIMERGNAVCDKLKSDPETALVHLTRCNRESALSDLRNLVDEIVVVNGK
jgi:nucleoside-triphosphatase